MIRFGPKTDTPDPKPATKAEEPATVPVNSPEASVERPAVKRKKSKDSGGEKLL